MILLSGWGVWLCRRKELDRLVGNRWFRRAALWGMLLPFIANTTGWVFTEAGRQPWIVYGLMKTAKGVSSVPTVDIALTLAAFVLVYVVLGAIDAWLLVRAARLGWTTPTTATRPLRAPRPRASSTEQNERTQWPRFADLNTTWFALIGLLWAGYFFLEGFDFGVAIVTPLVAADETDRRICLNSVGPVWDGNEVWLLTAGGATFAGLPPVVRTAFQRFLPGAVPCAAGVDSPRRVVRVQRQVRQPAMAARHGTGRTLRAASYRPSSGELHSPTWYMGCLWRPMAATTAGSSACCTRSHSPAGWQAWRCSRSTAPSSCR